MGIKVAVSCTLLYILVDVIMTTVLYTHGSQISIFTEDIQNFNILCSVLDLWGAVLVRASLLLGASIGVLWNREEGPRRVSCLSTLILLICLAIITYALVKLLMLTEQGPLVRQPWFLCLFSWTCVSSLGTVFLWRFLGRVPDSLVNSSGGRGGCGEETEKLVETAGQEEEEEGERGKTSQEKSNSGATLGRLLIYCTNDSGLLSVAFLFLIISAVCECP